MATAVESPTQLCAAAEQALLLSDYDSAEARARRCLDSGSMPAAVQERALVVALQALCEQSRVSTARRLLGDCYPRLEDAPANVALVWLALAVDSEHAEEAKQAMPALLSSCQPGTKAGWSRQQYLSLLHLYVFEALLPERRHAAEVARWVRTSELPITAEGRQLLLDELAAQQAGRQGDEPADAALEATCAQASSAADAVAGARPTGGPAAAAAPPEAPDLVRGQSAQQLPSKPVHQAAQGLAGAAAEATPAAAASGALKPHRQQEQQEPEIVPAPDPQCTSGSSGSSEPPTAVRAGVEWLSQAQQQAAQAAADFLRPLLVRPAADERSSRGAPAAAHYSPDPVQLAGGTVLGAVLVYALYAERQSLRRGAGRARRAVVGGTAQLLRMAFSLSINPAATSAPAWR